MADKVADVVVTFDVAVGLERKGVRYMRRDTSGAEVPVDEERDFPVYESRAFTIESVPQADVGALTDEALQARIIAEHGPQARLTGVEHRVRYV